MVLQHLRAFIKVCELGSMTHAAQALNLGQPAITKQIAALEQDLGVTLVVRRGRTLRPSPAGESVLHYACQIDNLVKECERAAQASKSPELGDVRIGTVDSLALFSLPKVLHEFTVQHPRTRLQVKLGSIQETLHRVLVHEVDLGMVTMPVQSSRIHSVPLFEDPVVLVAAPAMLERLDLPLSVQDLSQVEFISYQRPSRFRSLVEAALEEVGVRLNVVMELGSHEAVKTMVRLGFGVALAPLSSVAEDLAAGRLLEIPSAGLPHVVRTASLLLRKNDVRPAAVTRFLDVLAAAYPFPRVDMSEAPEVASYSKEPATDDFGREDSTAPNSTTAPPVSS